MANKPPAAVMQEVTDPQELAEVRARRIRFDARGCGRSSPLGVYTVQGAIDDLERIREHYGVDHWLLLGHSAGADIALAYALRFREHVLGVICLSGGRIQNDRLWHAEYARGRDAGLEPELEYAFPVNLEVNRQLNADWKAYCQSPGLLRALAKLNVPALFVYGDQDIRPAWAARQVAGLLPDSRFELLAGAVHNLWLTHSLELRTKLRAFVKAFPQNRK